MSNQRYLLLPVLLGLAIALSVAVQRVRLERSYQTVELIADQSEVAALAAYTGLAPADCLARLKAAGLTAVAVEEPTLEELRDAGRLTISAAAGIVTLRSADDLLVARLASHLGVTAPASGALRFNAPWAALANATIGLEPESIARIRSAGLRPVARLRNAPGMDEGAIRRAVRGAAKQGADLIIFSGDRVLGYRDLLDETAAAIVGERLAWGRVEFSRQRGEARLAEQLLGPLGASYLRVHSITDGEMAKLPPALAVERFRRAVEERNIRGCYIRLLLDPTADPLAANQTYIREIAEAIGAAGFELGAAGPLPRFEPGPARILALGLLPVAAAAAWLLTLLQPGPFTLRRWFGWWALLALGAAVLGLARPNLFAKLAGLAAGLVYPSLGARWVWLRLRLPPRSGWEAIGVLWGGAAFSICGGLLVVGLMSRTETMLAHEIFAGVKLTQMVPLLVAGLLTVTGLTLPAQGEPPRERWASFWRQPLHLAHIALTGLILIVLMLLLIRSGNEGADVSETELRFRVLLENLFGARPRTKEFLFGHPALLFAALAAWRGWRRWVAPCYLAGMIGLVSTFNTFCHLHTPLQQSLLRTIHALWLGTLLGLLGFAVVAWLRRRTHV